MADQPVPSVTEADVQRVVRRDFPPEQVAEALAVLAQYRDGENARVRLAVLKLAGGDLAALRREVAVACTDYRDVLAPAEYDRYLTAVPGPETLPEAEEAAVIEADWREYQEWLNR